MILRSGLFDAEFYGLHAANHGISRSDLIVEFLTSGDAVGKCPSAVFDSNLYLHLYPDVRVAGRGALGHFLRFGIVEGRILAVGDPPSRSLSDRLAIDHERPQRRRAPSTAKSAQDLKAVDDLHRACIVQLESIFDNLSSTAATQEFDLYVSRVKHHRAVLKNDSLLARVREANSLLQSQVSTSAAASAELEAALRANDILLVDLAEVEQERAYWRDRAEAAEGEVARQVMEQPGGFAQSASTRRETRE